MQPLRNELQEDKKEHINLKQTYYEVQKKNMFRM